MELLIILLAAGTLASEGDQSTWLTMADGTKLTASYNMTWAGNSTLDATTVAGGHRQCRYFPHFNGTDALPLPRCLFEAAIESFCTEDDPRYTTDNAGNWMSISRLFDTNLTTGPYAHSGVSISQIIIPTPRCRKGSPYGKYGETPKQCRTMLLSFAIDACESVINVGLLMSHR